MFSQVFDELDILFHVSGLSPLVDQLENHIVKPIKVINRVIRGLSEGYHMSESQHNNNLNMYIHTALTHFV